jgi:hypothetical protein
VVRAADSKESTVATCKILQLSCRFNPGGSTKTLGRKEKVEMHIALGISFGMIAAAPFVGRWRANVWLRKNMPAERSIKSIPEIA